MATHKAYRLHGYGGRDNITLDDVPVPAPGPGQVLVAVSAVGVNPFDWKIREGWVKDDMPLPLPYVMGVEFSGTVAAIGDAVTRFKIGDRVMAISERLCAFAEHIVAEERSLALVPDSLDDHEAATLPMPGLSAWQSLHAAGEVRSGAKVLVHGASGASGSLAVQFAKAAGATVIGTASGKNRDHVLGLGADVFVDYRTERFEDHVRDIDLVLDYVLVGGAENTTDRSWAVLKPGGAVVSITDPTIMGKIPDGYRGYFLQTSGDGRTLEEIGRKRAAGAIRTKIARVFPRGGLLDALDLNQAGGTTGRLIVDFRQS